MTPGSMRNRDVDETLSRLVTAFHILHHEEILDEHGEISVRHPHDPSTFFTSSLPAILVSSKAQLNQWNVSDGSPVPNPHEGCQALQNIPSNSEHWTHSALYNRHPGVQSILHSHCQTLLAYGLCDAQGSMLLPSYNMAGFLGGSTPIFDVANYYRELPTTHPQNLLINHPHLAERLADAFHGDGSPDTGMDGLQDGITVQPDGDPNELPAQACVFQRGHGFVSWATSIEDAVYKAIYLRRDGDIQTSAMLQREQSSLDVVYLSEREARDSARTINHASPMMWLAWQVEMERTGLYRNEMKSDQSPI